MMSWGKESQERGLRRGSSRRCAEEISFTVDGVFGLFALVVWSFGECFRRSRNPNK